MWGGGPTTFLVGYLTLPPLSSRVKVKKVALICGGSTPEKGEQMG